jgi:hypothetical protein
MASRRGFFQTIFGGAIAAPMVAAAVKAAPKPQSPVDSVVVPPETFVVPPETSLAMTLPPPLFSYDAVLMSTTTYAFSNSFSKHPLF